MKIYRSKQRLRYRRKGSKNRRSQITLLWILLLLIYLLSPLRQLLNQETLTHFLPTLGPWSAVLFISLYAISMVIGLPTVIFTLAGGSAFGLIQGTLYSTVGATLGAAGACWLSRYLLHQWAARKFWHHPTLQKFQQGIQQQALWFVILVRLSPVTPFNIENYLFGLTDVRWNPYLCGTVLGILPGTIAYTWVGVTGAEALKGQGLSHFLLAVILLMAISLFPILFNRNSSIKNNSIKNNSIKNNSIKNNSIKNNSIKNNSIKNNSIKNNSIKNNQR